MAGDFQVFDRSYGIFGNSGPGGAVARQTVIDRMNRFEDLMWKYKSELSAALDAIRDVKIREVAQPDRLNPPEFAPLPFNSGAVPHYSPSSPNIGDVPVLDGIGGLLRDLEVQADWDLPDLPDAPSVSIGDAPVLNAVEKPVRPVVDTDIAIPDAPDIVLPQMEALAEIVLPVFEFPQLPDFDGVPPSPDGIAVPDAFLNWSEPEYKSELLDDLVGQVGAMMKGGTGIPPVVEDALFARARERDGAETERAVQEVVQAWASRGFTLPQGVLDRQVAAVREQGRLKAAELNRDILIQAATWEIENLRFAVQQGIAVEGLLENIHENMLNRLFEAAKYSAEAQINVFNARIGLFNAQNQAFSTLADVYRTRLDGVRAKLEAYKAALEGQAVIGDLNRQKVDIFRAKLEAVNMNVERYKTMMSAASLRADVVSKQFDMYRSDIQAYTEELNAEKLKLDAYQTALQGEKAKADVYQAQVQAFAATVRAVSDKADISVKQANLKMDAAKLGLQEYSAKIDAYKARLQAEMGRIQYETQVFSAQVDAWKAESSASAAQAEMQAKYADMARQTNIAYAQMQIEQYRANVQQASNEAQIALEAAKAHGSFSAQLAAGALSAQHVSAGISASHGVSESRGQSESVSHNYSY